jgi:adenine-specific DNA methylase
MTGSPLLGPAETLLPAADSAEVAAALAAGTDPRDVAAAHPASGLAWAELAERELLAPAGSVVTAYAYARTGYHRSLDALRRAGWRGAGPVPWRHEPNRGFLRSLRALAEAAARIGEDDEAARCRDFLTASDPAVPTEIDV